MSSMLHLPSRPSAPTPMSGLIHNSNAPPPPASPTHSTSSSPILAASERSTNPTSPPSSLFELPPAHHQHHQGHGTTPTRNQRTGGLGRTAGTRSGPREKGKKVEEMSLEELGGTWERNKRVLGDKTIFPPLPPTSPRDPHQLKLLEAQSALEHRMSLLSTQASSPTSSSFVGISSMTSPGSSSGGRREGGPGEPIPPNVTPSRRGLTAPLALNESLALQASVYERARAREEERAALIKAREMENDMQRLSMSTAVAGPSSAGGQEGKLMDELERIRGQARMRAFMQPARPISRDPFYTDSADGFSDDDEANILSDGDGDDADLLDVDDILGAGGGGDDDEEGGMMIISQEEVERGWVEDGRSGVGGSGMGGSGRSRGNG